MIVSVDTGRECRSWRAFEVMPWHLREALSICRSRYQTCIRGRSCHSARAVRARCKLWVYLGPLLVMYATINRPPGMNKTYPEASGMYWQP